MPAGYQNKLSNTYWSSTQLSWDGTKWAGTGASLYIMNPTAYMDMTFAELRLMIKLAGGGTPPRLFRMYNSADVDEVYVLPAVANQFFTIRFNNGAAPNLKMGLDQASTIEILEIEAGYVGTHF